ncbi:MAG TPA: hypothetical protein VIX59_17145, partial [Candidatus Binataceae bacterium]
SLAALTAELRRVAPELCRGAPTLVDSPRAPAAAGRAIDAALRRVVARLAARSAPASGHDALRVSMFPTPATDYFAACIAARDCKPHLRALGREMLAHLAAQGGRGRVAAPSRGGALFTRFMLVGFAAHRALESAGVVAFESYPDLALRIWKPPGAALPPKTKGRAVALAARRRIVARLARRLALERFTAPRTLDEADAAVLALSAALARERGAGALLIEHRAEGRFLLALDAQYAARIDGFRCDRRALDKDSNNKVQQGARRASGARRHPALP